MIVDILTDDIQHIDNELHFEEKREASKLPDGWKGIRHVHLGRTLFLKHKVRSKIPNKVII